MQGFKNSSTHDGQKVRGVVKMVLQAPPPHTPGTDRPRLLLGCAGVGSSVRRRQRGLDATSHADAGPTALRRVDHVSAAAPGADGIRQAGALTFPGFPAVPTPG